MHEMGIITQIIEIASSSIPPEIKNPKVSKINLKIGKMTAVVPASLSFCFDIASKDTPLEGARLSIEEIPVVGRCQKCGHEWPIDSPDFKCEKCQHGQVDIISGRELDISSLELVN